MKQSKTKALAHARTARQLLDIADREIARSNVGLTSEMLWAAASHAVKAVCVNRGWPHGGYEDLQTAVKRLSEETGDKSLNTGFTIAYDGQLFVGSLEEDDVETDIPVVRRLVNKVLAAGVKDEQHAG